MWMTWETTTRNRIFRGGFCVRLIGEKIKKIQNPSPPSPSRPTNPIQSVDDGSAAAGAGSVVATNGSTTVVRLLVDPRPPVVGATPHLALPPDLRSLRTDPRSPVRLLVDPGPPLLQSLASPPLQDPRAAAARRVAPPSLEDSSAPRATLPRDEARSSAAARATAARHVAGKRGEEGRPRP